MVAYVTKKTVKLHSTKISGYTVSVTYVQGHLQLPAMVVVKELHEIQ